MGAWEIHEGVVKYSAEGWQQTRLLVALFVSSWINIASPTDHETHVKTSEA